MSFDEMINKSREVVAPEFDSQSASKNKKTVKMETLLERLKRVDSKTRTSIRLIQGLYVVMIGVATYYAFTLGQTQLKVGLGCIIVAFALVILVQQLRYTAYNYAYGDHTMIQFLQDAKCRMQVFTKRTWIVIPIWILINYELKILFLLIF